MYQGLGGERGGRGSEKQWNHFNYQKKVVANTLKKKAH